MKDRIKSRIVPNRTDRLGKTFLLMVNTAEEKEGTSTPPDQPRASSLINDSHCVTLLQARLLAGSSAQTIDNLLNVKPLDCTLKSVKNVSCVIPLSCAQPVTSVKNVASNRPVGARLQNFWQTWLDLGAGPKIVQILREGYTLPFQTRPNLTRSPTVVSRYVNPRRNSYLLEALHQLIDKNAIELVHNQTSLGCFNRLFLVPKPNKWRPILDLSKLNLFLKWRNSKWRHRKPSGHPSSKGSG